MNRLQSKRWIVSSLLLFLVASGCTCGGDDDGGGDGTGQDGGGNGDGGNGSGGDGGGGIGPSAEVCDGEDNDQNGIKDDVDVAGDGVCDCLRIATLGYPGAHGGGDVFNVWLNGKSNNGAVSLGDQTLTAALLEPYQVIVVQDVRASAAGQVGKGKGIGRSYTPEEVQVLEQWVKDGGGLMTLIGYGAPSEIVNVNKLLAPFGMSYGSVPILPKSGSQTVAVSHWATHPLSINVQKVGVDNGYEVFGGTLTAWESTPGNYDVGRSAEVEKGHVFVWGDEWITYDSEWQLRSDYQIQQFWLNSLKWLTPITECQVSVVFG